MPANTNAIGSTMRRSLDFGFLAGFALVALVSVALVSVDSVAVVAVALVWLVLFLKSLFWQILLRKAYTLATTSFNFMLPPFRGIIRFRLL